MLRRVVIPIKYMMLLCYVLCIHCRQYVLAWTPAERMHAGQVWKMTQTQYTELTGKDGEYEDLVESLRNPKVTEKWVMFTDMERLGKELPLVANNPSNMVYKATLSMLLYSEKEHPDLMKDITQVYEQSQHWGVRLLCVKLAERYGRKDVLRTYVDDISTRMGELKGVKMWTTELDELNTALQALSSFEIRNNYPGLSNVIHRCYVANKKTYVGQSFPNTMKYYNANLSQQYWVDYAVGIDGIGLDQRLPKAEELFDLGALGVYPILFEGLISQRPWIYDRSVKMRNQFMKYDGKVYNQKEDVINIKALNDKCALIKDEKIIDVQKNVAGRKLTYNADNLKVFRIQRLKKDQLTLWERIHYASVFLDNGWLTGFSVLREGLNSPDEYSRRKADELLGRYRAFDGQTCPDTGIKIDIDALLSEIKSTKIE